MRAILIKDGKGPVENLYIGEAPKPTLGKGDVLVKESLQASLKIQIILRLKLPLDTSIWLE